MPGRPSAVSLEEEELPEELVDELMDYNEGTVPNLSRLVVVRRTNDVPLEFKRARLARGTVLSSAALSIVIYCVELRYRCVQASRGSP